MKRALAGVLLVVLLLVAGTASYLELTERSGTAPGGTHSSSTSSSTLAATTSTTDSSSTSSGAQQSPTPIKHVIVILMENEAYDQVIGSSVAPFETSLAAHYASAANYFAVTHPSLPNYFALVAGSTFGITTDCSPSQCSISGPTIASLIDARGLSWKEYAESMSANCSQSDGAGGQYVTKHDPFVYFSGISGDAGSGTASQYCDSHVVAFSQFWIDLQSSNLPAYSFITPNICDDAHSCPLSTGDAWLSSVVSRIIDSSSFASSAVFVTYDEGSGSASNTPSQVACVLVSPFARQGFASDVHYTHYSLLATVESILGLGNLGRGDATANVMSDIFTIGLPPAASASGAGP